MQYVKVVVKEVNNTYQLVNYQQLLLNLGEGRDSLK